jgi:hypothetical protein
MKYVFVILFLKYISFLLLQIPEDLKSLITALTPLKYLSKSKLTEGSSLNSAIVRNLTEKVC